MRVPGRRNLANSKGPALTGNRGRLKFYIQWWKTTNKNEGENCASENCLVSSYLQILPDCKGSPVRTELAKLQDLFETNSYFICNIKEGQMGKEWKTGQEAIDYD